VITGIIMVSGSATAAMLQTIEGKLGDIKDQVMVDVFEGGVHVQLADKTGKPMFEADSSEPAPQPRGNEVRI
jgi:hypothetical protein